eukprot:Skav209790  [mRNA]  locus=scaffold1201:11124:13502:- [translate_table: standard]
MARKGTIIRPSRDLLPAHWMSTCRIVVAFAQIGSMNVRVITVYGVQPKAPHASAKNASLWYALLEILASSNVPTLLGGDMNVRPQNMDTWSEIEALGYFEAFDFMLQRSGVDLPFTCNDATRHDTLVFSSHFARSFHSAYVEQGTVFPSHCPLIVSFDMHVPFYQCRSFPTPEPMDSRVLDDELFQNRQCALADRMGLPSYSHDVERFTHDEMTTCLQKVGKCFESAYDQTVRMTNAFMHESWYPRRSNVKCKRLRPVNLSVVLCPATPRRARCGEYEPPCETSKFKHRMWTNQLRRMHALLRRIRKYDGVSMPSHVERQNVTEWNAIAGNRAFRPSFGKWMLRMQFCAIWYQNLDFPWQWLDDLCSAFQAFLDAQIRQYAMDKQKMHRHYVELDLLHFGGGYSHAILRNTDTPRPLHFQLTETFHATRLRQQGKTKPCVRISDAGRLIAGLPIQIEQQEIQYWVDDADDNVLHLDSIPDGTAASFQLQQLQSSQDPDKLAKAFFDYWAPYWLRDEGPALHDVSMWQDFLDLTDNVAALPAGGFRKEFSLSDWKCAVSGTKATSARGSCGLSQPELRAMNDKLVNVILDVFNRLDSAGFPKWLMLARVILLPKRVGASVFAQMRPITICSMLYRMWAKMLARKLLQQWKVALPMGIVGSVPGRSGTQLTLSAALRIENAIYVGSELGGYNLDIQKCFNAVGRLPAKLLMVKHGLPGDIAEQWVNSLFSLGRTVKILDSYSMPVLSSTGIAEGDPLSVATMVLLGYSWAEVVAIAGVLAQVYADDWGRHAADS